MSIFHQQAAIVYDMPLETLQQRVMRLRLWPKDRQVDRVLPVDEAVKRLKNPAIRLLVLSRAVVIVESYDRLYPIQTLALTFGEAMVRKMMRENGLLERSLDQTPDLQGPGFN